jgi:hypothetical protein
MRQEKTGQRPRDIAAHQKSMFQFPDATDLARRMILGQANTPHPKNSRM